MTVGFLWLLVAWINEPRFPANLRHSLLVSRVIKDASGLTPVLLIFVISSAAYLLGLIFEIIDEAIVKILVVALPVGFVMSIGLLLGVLWPITLPMAAILAGNRRLASVAPKESYSS